MKLIQKMSSISPSTTISDENLDDYKRKLPPNEALALALSELAIEADRDFFLYLPSSDLWKTHPNEARLPKTRTPIEPGYERSYCHLGISTKGQDFISWSCAHRLCLE